MKKEVVESDIEDDKILGGKLVKWGRVWCEVG